MLPGRDRPGRPPVEPRGELCHSRYVVSDDVLMLTFFDVIYLVCCEELLYYAASTAVLLSNRDLGINRYFHGKSSAVLDTSCCNFAASILHVEKKSSCTTVPHLVRS